MTHRKTTSSVVRSGLMRWTVENQTLVSRPGAVIVTPAGTAHSYEVGRRACRVVCIDAPVRPGEES